MPKRHLMLAGLLVLAVLSLSPLSPAPARPVGLSQALVRVPEVKLRKLHLVRPDLISFPIYFEVYC